MQPGHLMSPSCWFRWGLPAPMALGWSNLPYEKSSDPSLRVETPSWLLGRPLCGRMIRGKEEEVKPAAWEPRTALRKTRACPPLFLNTISTERKEEPSPAQPVFLWSEASFPSGFPT